MTHLKIQAYSGMKKQLSPPFGWEGHLIFFYCGGLTFTLIIFINLHNFSENLHQILKFWFFTFCFAFSNIWNASLLKLINKTIHNAFTNPFLVFCWNLKICKTTVIKNFHLKVYSLCAKYIIIPINGLNVKYFSCLYSFQIGINIDKLKNTWLAPS